MCPFFVRRQTERITLILTSLSCIPALTPNARLIKTYALGQDNSVSLLQFTKGLDTPIFVGSSRSHADTQFCSRVSLSVGSSPTRERGRDVVFATITQSFFLNPHRALCGLLCPI